MLRPAMRASGPTPLRLLGGSFLLLVAVGTVLLKLPFATPADQRIGWVDALFTATSATCVTGLAVRDTGTGFTFGGQLVILGLIQAGGLGIMTFSLFILALVRGGRVSLAQRALFEQSLAGAIGHHLWPMLRLVLRFTFAAEALGALLLFIRWRGRLGTAEAAWSAVFHAVSAFCNAGFSLWSDNLIGFRGDPWTILTISGLIVLGGLGFLTVYDLWTSPRLDGRLSVNSKLALVVSGVLIAGGALLVWMLEARRAFAGMGALEQALAALFQSVTTRTAGFNSVDIGALAPGTLFLMTILMFVGGSPGSCAGGIKTTTLGILVLAAVTRLRGHLNVNVFRRTLPPTIVRDALTVALGAVAGAVAAVFVLLLIESPGRTVDQERAVFIGFLFETVSALGTVGLSTGVTPTLSPAGRLFVSLLMFCGRLGPLTLATAFAAGSRSRDWRYPEEEVMVG